MASQLSSLRRYSGQNPGSRAWYEQLLLGEPTFFPHATEVVWTLAENRSVYVVEDAEGAGHSAATIFVDDLDSQVAAITARGLRRASVSMASSAGASWPTAYTPRRRRRSE